MTKESLWKQVQLFGKVVGTDICRRYLNRSSGEDWDQSQNWQDKETGKMTKSQILFIVFRIKSGRKPALTIALTRLVWQCGDGRADHLKRSRLDQDDGSALIPKHLHTL